MAGVPNEIYGLPSEAFVAIVAAVGAIAAAIIAGLVAFFSFIISKEQSISEFRQKWIDALRKDIAIIVGCITCIHGESIAADDDTALWNRVREEFIRFNRVRVRIKLRLNPDENTKKEGLPTKAVLDALKELESIFASQQPRLDRLPPLVEILVTNSQLILKTNWDRVRSGEPVYRRIKWGVLILTVALIVSGFIAYGLYVFKTICR